MERELFCVSLMMMVTFATMAHHIHEHGDGAGARAVLEGIIMYTMHTTAARGCRGPHVAGVWGPGVSVPAAGARRPPAELTPVQPCMELTAAGCINTNHANLLTRTKSS